MLTITHIVRSTKMDSTEFTLDGDRFRLSRDMVIKAMRNQTPGTIQTYAVDIDGVLFPVNRFLRNRSRSVVIGSSQLGRKTFLGSSISELSTWSSMATRRQRRSRVRGQFVLRLCNSPFSSWLIGALILAKSSVSPPNSRRGWKPRLIDFEPVPDGSRAIHHRLLVDVWPRFGQAMVRGQHRLIAENFGR